MLVSEMFPELERHPQLCEHCNGLVVTSLSPADLVLCLDCQRAQHEHTSPDYIWDNYYESNSRIERLTKAMLGVKS